eukprot:2044638-Pleurochrysis_carterae.AAC.1
MAAPRARRAISMRRREGSWALSRAAGSGKEEGETGLRKRQVGMVCTILRQGSAPLSLPHPL